MAVSKRTRYEVLRRDNHTCRYCGGTAPDVTLTVDHVIPVSLGGSDEPSNLVAACKDCNAGKSSSNPDAPLVDGVAADALRYAAALRVAMDQAREDWTGREEYRATFLKAWKRHDRRALILPKTWVPSLNTWHDMGVPIELLCEAADIAFGQDKVANGDVFRYTAGVVWRRLDDIRSNAETTTPQSSPKNCGHCIVCRGSGPTEDDMCELENMGDPACRHCGRQDCAYEIGLSDGSIDGYTIGSDTMRNRYQYRDHGTRLLEMVVDGR